MGPIKKKATGEVAQDVPNPAAPSVPEDRISPVHGDMSMFVWQKLNDLDARFAEFSEKYGRVEARLDAIDNRLEKTEEKLSEVRDSVRSAKVWIAAAIAICSVLVAAYKLIEHHVIWQ